MSHEIRGWELDSAGGPPNNGQCFIAIDPAFFAPGCSNRVASTLNHYRNMEPVKHAVILWINMLCDVLDDVVNKS